MRKTVIGAGCAVLLATGLAIGGYIEWQTAALACAGIAAAACFVLGALSEI